MASEAKQSTRRLEYGMTPWRYILRTLRSLFSTRRIYRLDAELYHSLRLVAEREQRPARQVASELLSYAIAHRQEAEANLERWQRLSPREQQVAALVCLNLTNAQIAARLVIAPETVKTHVRHALQKFNLRTKAELRHTLSDWDFSAWLEADLR